MISYVLLIVYILGMIPSTIAWQEFRTSDSTALQAVESALLWPLVWTLVAVMIFAESRKKKV